MVAITPGPTMSDALETSRPNDGQLDSWKEIAAHLGRDVRTVQRWEKGEGLPVHRHLHDKLGSVYAFRSELDAWLAGREAALDSGQATVQTEAPAPDPARRRLRFWLLSLAAALVLAAAGAWAVLGRKAAPPQGPFSVAVLPFANLSGDPAQEYFSDGITEELITQLGRLQEGNAPIVALGSTLAYKRNPRPPRQVAAELGVAYVMEGSVRRSGDRARINVHLVRGRDEAHLWDQSYDCDVGDILALQNVVAGAITTALRERLRRPPAPAAAGARPETLEAYLKGRFFWNKRTPADLLRAMEFYRRAIALEDGFAPAYAGLAECLVLLGSAEMGAMAPADAMPKAREAAAKALALDPGLAEAHAALALVKLAYDWDWAGAEQSFRKATLLNPDCVTAHQWFALYFNALGRTNEALAEVRKAGQLDPLSPTVKTALAETYYFARRFPEAEAASRAALEMDPGFLLGWVNLGRALEYEGRYDEAAAGLEKAWLASGKAPGLAMLLGHVQARKGDLAKARRMLAELKAPPAFHGKPAYVPAIFFAALHSALGDRAAALASLRKAVEERCEYLIYLDWDPMSDGMRNDPEVKAILRLPAKDG